MFQRGKRSPETEARLRPVLDRLFETKVGEKPLYEMECRGVVCKLDTHVAMDEWQEALHRDVDGMGWFSSMQVGDPTSYLRLEEPGRVAGIQYFIKLVMALEASPAVAACKVEYSTKGVVRLALKLDPAKRQVNVEASGALANQGGGVCIRRVLEGLVAATPLPPHATEIPDEPFHVAVP